MLTWRAWYRIKKLVWGWVGGPYGGTLILKRPDMHPLRVGIYVNKGNKARNIGFERNSISHGIWAAPHLYNTNK